MKNWYLYTGNETYGPFSMEELQAMGRNRQILPETLICDESNNWIQAQSLPALQNFLDYSSISNQEEVTSNVDQVNTVASPTIKSKKKGKGCLLILVVFTVFLIVIVGLLRLASNNSSQMIKLDKSTKELSTRVDKEGSRIIIRDSDSDIEGFIIDIPAGSYSEDLDFTISSRPIKSHSFGDAFNPITPLISIDNNEVVAKEVLYVSIPVDLEEDEFAMGFYYTEDNKLEAMPLIYQDTDQIIVSTKHFSDILFTKISEEDLLNLDLDTGFRPGVDDWSFVNTGSQIAPGGFCAGQTTSMAYYYFEKKLKGESSLFTRYDNNHESFLTPQLGIDDSMGIRLASVVQEEGDWNSVYFEYGIVEFIHINKYISDRQIYLAFTYAMLLTKEPQLMGIFDRYLDDEQKIDIEAGHAILAYRITSDRIYVCDPNYPGNTNLYVAFSGSKLGPYNSQINIDADNVAYNSFSLIGKSALFDWQAIGELFEEIEVEANESKIGDQYFNTTNYFVYTDIEDNELVEISRPNYVEVDDLSINKIKEHFRNARGLPDDFQNRDYLIAYASIGQRDGFVDLYSGTTKIATFPVDHEAFNIIPVPLHKGLNDIGLHFSEKRTVTDGYYEDYIDFIRFKVENGREDITGIWEGEFQIKDISGVQDYAQGIGEYITKLMVKGASTIFDFEMPSDDVISEAVSAGIEVNQDALEAKAIRLDISQIDEENYDIEVTTVLDDTFVYNTKAKYEDTLLSFSVVYDDGSSFDFELQLYNHFALTGGFEVIMPGMGQMISGDTQVKRVD